MMFNVFRNYLRLSTRPVPGDVMLALFSPSLAGGGALRA